MIIKHIKLINFRNHSEYIFDCKDETSLILGENGSGKTSVLEAIYILTQGKSFRATDPEILKHGTEYYRIELEYENGEKTIATYDGKNKQFIKLDKKTKRLSKKHKYPVVLFLPSDLNLIDHSPGRRRDYFNRILSQLDEKYSTSISRYEKALKQRNEILKRENVSKEELFSWNILLSKYGTEIYNSRKTFVQDLNSRLTEIYRTIAKNSDEIDITYKTEIEKSSEEYYLKKLEDSFLKDSYLGYTTFGIHKDDFVFNFNKNLANGSASRGETRSVILALKFIEAKLIYEKLNQKPIVLLDDVFSELDEMRRKCLIENFKENQVIITSVEKLF